MCRRSSVVVVVAVVAVVGVTVAGVILASLLTLFWGEYKMAGPLVKDKIKLPPAPPLPPSSMLPNLSTEIKIRNQRNPATLNSGERGVDGREGVLNLVPQPTAKK